MVYTLLVTERRTRCCFWDITTQVGLECTFVLRAIKPIEGQDQRIWTTATTKHSVVEP